MSRPQSRRSFLSAAGLATLAPWLPGAKAASLQAPTSAMLSNAQSFPKDFLWGTATAAYQVEGAVRRDGRGPTIWDTFSHQPGKTSNGDTGDTADEFYDRYYDDIRLMKSLGVRGLRFSIAWSRIFPNGSGQPNVAGVDFYRRLVTDLRSAGIEPCATLYHWDLPQSLQDKGGWENHDTASRFGDYAGYIAGRLKEVVSHFMTTNEISTFTESGYGTARHAPGLSVGPRRLAQLTHHAVLAHGLGVRAIRSSAPRAKVGLAENPRVPIPVAETPEHVQAARSAMREANAQYLGVILGGGYTPHYLKHLGEDAPKFTAEELAIISSPLDSVGLNIYTGFYVQAAENEIGYQALPRQAGFPRMGSDWLTVVPESLYWGPRLTHDLWQPKTMFITENGCSADDELTPEGEVYDTARLMYLRSYLTRLARAVHEQSPVSAYFLWSLLDNFEWADGYSKRFGINYVDFKTQKRTPKLSARFYRQVIAGNGVA